MYRIASLPVPVLQEVGGGLIGL